MAYAHATLLDAVTALAARLSDSGTQFWSSSELEVLICEALRTWNALTSFWRGEFVFNLANTIWWYDLTAQTNSLRPLTLHDTDLIGQIEYHLLEPITASYPLTWTGSNQFAVADILGAIQRRRDETLSITGCHLTRSLVPAVPARITLSDSVIDIRRVAWLPSTHIGFSNSPLTPSDLQTKKYFDPGWTTAHQETPQTYLRNAEPPLSFDVDREPPVPGQYELITVNAGTALSSTAASILGIPDDWSWVVKFGALSDLLNRESLAKDALRAEYCAKRYAQGLVLLRDASALLGLRVNNIPFDVDSLKNADYFNPSWQELAGSPKAAYVAGLNLIAFRDCPDSSTAYSVTAHVVQNAPLPVLPGDSIQLSREDYDCILDYGQHLAAFKLGGGEFLATMPLYDRFMKRAAIYNSKLAATSELQKSMYEISQLEQQRNPTYSPETAQKVTS